MDLLLLIELIFGVKLVITGDKVNVNDCPLIIMNHRCRLDYMFYWMVLLRNGRLANEKIIMKNELKYMPALGEFFARMFIFFSSWWKYLGVASNLCQLSKES